MNNFNKSVVNNISTEISHIRKYLQVLNECGRGESGMYVLTPTPDQYTQFPPTAR